MDSVQLELCEGLYKQFSNMVEEMTNLCVESEKQLEEFKKNLQEKVIPEKVKCVSISFYSSWLKILLRQRDVCWLSYPERQKMLLIISPLLIMLE